MTPRPVINNGRALIANVAERFGLEVSDLWGRRRHRYLSRARAAAATELMRRHGWTLGDTSAVLGRNHATVLYLIRTHGMEEKNNCG